MVWWVIAIALALLWSYGWLRERKPSWLSRVTRRKGIGRGVVNGDGEFGLYAVSTSHHQAQLEKIANARAQRSRDPLDAAVLGPEHAQGDSGKISVTIDSIEVARLHHDQARDFERALRRAGCADAACLAEIIGAGGRGQIGVRLNARMPFVIVPAEFTSA